MNHQRQQLEQDQQDQDDSTDDLFTLSRLDDYATRLTVGQDLKTFYGRWTIQIEVGIAVV